MLDWPEIERRELLWADDRRYGLTTPAAAPLTVMANEKRVLDSRHDRDPIWLASRSSV